MSIFDKLIEKGILGITLENLKIYNRVYFKGEIIKILDLEEGEEEIADDSKKGTICEIISPIKFVDIYENWVHIYLNSEIQNVISIKLKETGQISVTINASGSGHAEVFDINNLKIELLK